METFGKTKDNQFANLYTLENDYMTIKVCDYGATLVSVILKNDGHTNVVLGFDDVLGYELSDTCMGQTIGRCANRIEKGIFKLNGVQYNIPINNNGNSLHGGINGFNHHFFKIKEINNRLECYYTSNDGEEGFPGTLEMFVTYSLNGNKLEIEYNAESDKDTVCSLTNHSYFNLKGFGTVLDHELWVDANKVGNVDSNGLSLESTFDVTDTPFDFREFKKIEDQIYIANEQLTKGNGYDHNFCLNGNGVRKVASLKYNKLQMNVYTDLNNMQIYTANYMNEDKGRNNTKYNPRDGIAFETQYYPNAINYNRFTKPILKRSDIYNNKTIFEFIF